MTKIAKSDKHRHVYLQDQGVILLHIIRIHDGLDIAAKIQWYTRQPNKTLQCIDLTLNNIYAGSTPR